MAPRARAKARILADEGFSEVMNTTEVALRKRTYIVEVHPEGAPAFRTEVTAWVSRLAEPQEGDILEVLYTPPAEDIELAITGDPRFDWKLRADAEQTREAARREELLNEPASQEPLTDPADAEAAGAAQVDEHEAQLLGRIDALLKDKRGGEGDQ